MELEQAKKRKILIDGKEFSLGDLADDDDGVLKLSEKISLKQKLDSEGSGEADTWTSKPMEALFTPPKKGKK